MNLKEVATKVVRLATETTPYSLLEVIWEHKATKNVVKSMYRGHLDKWVQAATGIPVTQEMAAELMKIELRELDDTGTATITQG
jgi:hypothetical protein